ncbi:MAG: flagellar FliJ family protein [Alphaproteobacteria bacterium]|nr:flagellar FliJ family protein [Alphaproteobacteria bacterium]
MRGLETLIRVKRWEIDGLRRTVAEAESLVARRQEEAARFEIAVVREQQQARADEVGAYGYAAGYASAVIATRADLSRALAAAESHAAEARDRLAEAYAELKRFEIVQEAREKRAQLAEQRRETIQLDELGIELHRRRSN